MSNKEELLLTDEELLALFKGIDRRRLQFTWFQGVAKAAVEKVLKAGYLSPEEVEEKVKGDKEQIFEELKAYAELLLAFIDKEKNHRDKGAFIITVKDMIRSMVIMEKPEAIEKEGER